MISEHIEENYIHKEVLIQAIKKIYNEDEDTLQLTIGKRNGLDKLERVLKI